MKIETTNDIMEATREELIDYALDVTSERNDIKAENAELKARLEKAVELKYHEGDYVYFISWLSGNVCEGEIIGWQEDSGYAIQTGDALISAYSCFDTREAAEARLKELEEQK